jgi:hypothetical protein
MLIPWLATCLLYLLAGTYLPCLLCCCIRYLHLPLPKQGAGSTHFMYHGAAKSLLARRNWQHARHIDSAAAVMFCTTPCRQRHLPLPAPTHPPQQGSLNPLRVPRRCFHNIFTLTLLLLLFCYHHCRQRHLPLQAPAHLPQQGRLYALCLPRRRCKRVPRLRGAFRCADNTQQAHSYGDTLEFSGRPSAGINTDISGACKRYRNLPGYDHHVSCRSCWQSSYGDVSSYGVSH